MTKIDNKKDGTTSMHFSGVLRNAPIGPSYSTEHAATPDKSLAIPAESYTPSEFVDFLNQSLEYAYSSVVITGEVSEFKVNQGKWVFFNIKDNETSVPCFMTLWSLHTPIEDGMRVAVRGTPKVTKWGKFSFTVTKLSLIGEGSIKKAYEILKKKLAGEGLFAPEKKRGIPEDLTRLGVISSLQAAGYKDFIKIANARWGGMKIYVAHTQVQGMDAPEQIIRALKYFNERGEVQMIAVLRGGGSADDLACFNDEALVRAIAASKIPVITGIGHEVDESLADLAADVRASTPSRAAELLTRDRKTEKVHEKITRIYDKISSEIRILENSLKQKRRIIETLNPENVLRQGYAIIAGERKVGSTIKITTMHEKMEAEVKKIEKV